MTRQLSRRSPIVGNWLSGKRGNPLFFFLFSPFSSSNGNLQKPKLCRLKPTVEELLSQEGKENPLCLFSPSLLPHLGLEVSIATGSRGQSTSFFPQHIEEGKARKFPGDIERAVLGKQTL
jgi:hypothetical protein